MSAEELHRILRERGRRRTTRDREDVKQRGTQCPYCFRIFFTFDHEQQCPDRPPYDPTEDD
jgi:hypothetical protein